MHKTLTDQNQDVFNSELYGKTTGPKYMLNDMYGMPIKARFDCEKDGVKYHIWHLSTWGWNAPDQIRIDFVDLGYADITYYVSFEVYDYFGKPKGHSSLYITAYMHIPGMKTETKGGFDLEHVINEVVDFVINNRSKEA